MTTTTSSLPEPADSPAALLDARLAQMRAALDACPREVPAALALPARASLDEVAERLALGVDHTVVALFGGTGSGKSSLFNALTQLQFADVGARRPTTARAAACSWGDDAAALLTFLGVDSERRIRRESLLDAADQDALAGLVLLDVPDYDSVTTAHALQVDRLVPLADILVWVLDPQKYADSALHDGYLRNLGARQEDMLILVNQVDTLPAGGLDKLMADVRELLAADGLTRVTVLPVSAVRGDGLGTVRDLLHQRVVQESNAARTASAELDAIAGRLSSTAADEPVSVSAQARDEVVQALVQASGTHAVESAMRASLARALPGSLTRPEPPAQAAVSAARTRWLSHETADLPPAWVTSLENEVARADSLAARTAEAVGSVPMPAARTPLISLAWWLGVLAVLGAVAWFVVSHATALVAAVPVAVGVCLAAWATYARRRRAVRVSRAYGQAVRSRIEAVVDASLVEPARQVLARHEVLRRALAL